MQEIVHSSGSVQLRVAVLTTSFPLDHKSTSGIFVARLFENMPANVGIKIITPAGIDNHRKKTRGTATVLPVRYAPKSWRSLAHGPGGLPVALRTQPWLYLLVPMLLAALAYRLAREAKECDVIHANWAICGLIAGLVGKLVGRPVITTLRGEDVTRSRLGKLSRIVLAIAIRWSKQVAAVSTGMAAWLQEEFPGAKNKICLCENGIDPSFLAISRESQAPDADVVLITVGSLIPRKGIDVLVRSLARIARLPQWQFRIVGAGPEEGRLRRLASELGVASRVIFVGELVPTEIVSEMEKADIFLLGSHSEGRPNALIEAMAAKLPVVASDISGVIELIENGVTGLMAPPGDEEAWSAAIEKLLADPELRRSLGAAARTRIRSLGLDWEATANRYIRLYRSAIDN